MCNEGMRTAQKRCGGRRPGVRCRLDSGHPGRHGTGAVSWINLRDPDCFACGKKATRREWVPGFGKSTICDAYPECRP